MLNLTQNKDTTSRGAWYGSKEKFQANHPPFSILIPLGLIVIVHTLLFVWHMLIQRYLQVGWIKPFHRYLPTHFATLSLVFQRPFFSHFWPISPFLPPTWLLPKKKLLSSRTDKKNFGYVFPWSSSSPQPHTTTPLHHHYHAVIITASSPTILFLIPRVDYTYRIISRCLVIDTSIVGRVRQDGRGMFPPLSTRLEMGRRYG